ncbi:MAG: hypothetical protein ACKOC5_01085 [Chloroflexota bacterium]
MTRLRTLIGDLLGAGRGWGYLRLLLAAGVVFLMAVQRRAAWAEPGVEVISWQSWGFLRYLLPGLAACLAGLLAAGNYTARLYNLPGLRVGLRCVLAAAFSIRPPVVQVENGAITGDEEPQTILRDFGGPGVLQIRPGSAVVLESLSHPTNVYGAGVHTLTRLERIREVINLADQQGENPEVRAVTKDGIPVRALRVRYRYRLRTGRQARDYRLRTAEEPFPFSPRAAHDLTYRRSIGAPGLTPWDQAVRIQVEGVVTKHINESLFDEVTAPIGNQEDPRAVMSRDMQAAQLRNTLKNFGTELLWFDIGSHEPESPLVSQQHVDTWGATRIGEAGVEAAEAEAHRQQAQELGRAEAQADLLRAVTETLRQAGGSAGSPDMMRNLIVMRTTQLLETMVESSRVTASRSLPEHPHPAPAHQ